MGRHHRHCFFQALEIDENLPHQQQLVNGVFPVKPEQIDDPFLLITLVTREETHHDRPSYRPYPYPNVNGFVPYP